MIFREVTVKLIPCRSSAGRLRLCANHITYVLF